MYRCALLSEGLVWALSPNLILVALALPAYKKEWWSCLTTRPGIRQRTDGPGVGRKLLACSGLAVLNRR